MGQLQQAVLFCPNVNSACESVNLAEMFDGNKFIQTGLTLLYFDKVFDMVNISF